MLGLQGNPRDDEFLYKVRVNFSPKMKKVRSGPNVSHRDCNIDFPLCVTRRMILSQIP